MIKLFSRSTRSVETENSTRRVAVNSTLIPIAIGQALASAEALTLGPLYNKNGLLRGVSARGSRPGTIRHTILSALDSPKTPQILAVINLASAGMLLLAKDRRNIQIVSSALIGICNRLNELRTPYGRDGADQMTAVITQYRVLSAFIPGRAKSDDFFLRAVNYQAGLSYFVSGISKLFGSSWVQGDALGEIIQTRAYGGGPAAKVLRAHPRLTRTLTWITPIWEAAFPLIYLLPEAHGRAALIGVKGFHVAVASVMELPRFIWGFSGSHGAVQYVIGHDRPRKAKTDQVAVAASVLLAYASCVYGAGQRALDRDRRAGLRGTQLLDVEDGSIEYVWTEPLRSDVDAASAPIVFLEAGLGNSLEAWSWISEDLSQSCHVVAYHRAGYGRTTSSATPAASLDALVRITNSSGPLIAVSHSIGVLRVAEYALSEVQGRRLRVVVVVDGTDPDLLAADRANRRRVGLFIQSQAHTMFAALTGVYNFAPNAVARQSRYEPDEQNAVLQFVFSPRNIYRAIREYFEVATDGSAVSLQQVPSRILVSSSENERQQRDLAGKLAAEYRLIPDSSHRSILGYRQNASQVAAIIQKAIDDVEQF